MIRHYWNLLLSKYRLRSGLKLMNKSRFQEAAVQLEKSLLLNNTMENFFYYAVCLIALNKHHQAITYLERILDTHIDDVLLATTLAECYMVVREWAKAERILSVLHSKHKENLTIKYLYLTVSDPAERERYAEAKEYFFEAKELLDTKQYDQAIDAIKKAIELNDTNSSFYFFASVIMLEAHKDKAEVEKYLEKAVYMSPQNETYKRHLQFVKTRYKKVGSED